MAFTSGYLEINQTHGFMSNISEDGKKRLAKKVLAIAKKDFVFDMGRGHGLFLISAYLEAQTLPGKDAAFVRFIADGLLAEALANSYERMDRETVNVTKDMNSPALVERPRERLTTIVRKYSLRITDEGDDIYLVAAVAAHITRTVIIDCGWEPKNLPDDQKFAAAVFSIVAADYCSRLVGRPLEMAHTITVLELFWPADPSALGSLIRQAAEEYNRMLANPIDYQVIKSIGNNIAKWIDERGEKAPHKLSLFLKIIVEAPIKPRPTDQTEAKTLAGRDSKPPGLSQQASVRSPAAARERRRAPTRAAAICAFAFLVAVPAAATFTLALPGHEGPAFSEGASDYVRISPGDSAKISVSPAGPRRYHVTGFALWGEYRGDTHPVHTGELDFTAELRGDALEHSERYGDRVYRVVLRFSGDMLHVTEENWVGMHGMNVTFEGAYSRDSGGL
jgi:hypothetical protein